MFRRNTGAVMLALAATLPFVACDGGTETEFGTLDILLTDAPGDFAQAVVNIERIYLQPGEDLNGPGRVDLMTEARTEDLLELANATAEMVSGAEVPAGLYEQLRFVVGEACIEVENDAGGTDIFATSTGFTECGTPEPDGELICPSCAQTGFKVLLNGGLEVTGTQQVLLVDFDVSETFGREAGLSGRWVMQPVIKASDITLTGGIDVTLALADGVTMPDGFALSDFAATLDTEAVPVAFADNDGDGVFTASFLFLIPDDGPFSVGVEGPDDLEYTLDPTAPQSVSLASGQVETVAYTVTAASLPAP